MVVLHKRNKESVIHKAADAVPKKNLMTALKKVIPVFVSALIIFSAGWAIGGGRLDIHRNRAVHSNSKLPNKLDYSSVDVIYQSMKDNFDGTIDQAKLLEGIKTGLANAAGDPYTEYFSPTDAKDFYGQLDGTFEGIGAELGKDANGNIQIIAPLAGYPAEKAGLKSKDLIAQIDGKTTTGFSIDDAVKLIRGKAGTTVKLTVVRSGTALDITITRESIQIPSVKFAVKDGIGILTISRFGEDTTKLVQDAANSFKSQNVRGVVLDLRGDPGGLLDAAVNVSSLWLKDKTVLTERRDGKVIQTYSSHGEATLNGIPTVVLINGGSASASEITAGALHDNNAATLMGVKSYGKGSVQQPIDLKDGSLLKVTIARWYTPAGKNIDKEGITPDKEVKISDDELKAGKDPQLDTALSQLKG
jgi:carboxyl-terminal processing protease